jgi:hypothetical protein
MEVTPVSQGSTPAQAKIQKATTSGTYNEIKAFLGANGLSGSVANAIGGRISGGKPASEWTQDEAVLKQVMAALRAGEVE